MYNYPIHSIEFGKGKSFVLFLHGWGGSTNSFLSIAKRISIQHKVMLVDFYGFGETKFPKNVLDTYEYALQLYLFLKRKKINEISIVAHSFGGRVAMILASVFNLKITQLILVNSAGVLPKRTIGYRYRVLKYKICKKLSKYKLIPNTKLSKYGSVEYKQLNDIQKVSYVKIVNQGLEYLMPKIHSKTLLVWGEKDNTTPLTMAKQINSLIKESKLFIYEGAGHFSHIENHSHFCNILLAYLKE